MPPGNGCIAPIACENRAQRGFPTTFTKSGILLFRLLYRPRQFKVVGIFSNIIDKIECRGYRALWLDSSLWLPYTICLAHPDEVAHQ